MGFWMFLASGNGRLRYRVLRLRLSFCKIQPAIDRSRQKENRADYRNYFQFAGFTSEKLTFEIPCISMFLTTSSPAEGKVRSFGGNCSPWRMHASSVVKFALVLMVRSVWQISEVVSMKLLHVVKQKFDRGPQDLDKLCKSNTTQNMGTLQKPGFSRKNKEVFFPLYWTYKF